MYEELQKVKLNMPYVGVPAHPANNYQSIPDNILDSYTFDSTLEHNCIEQYKLFIEYNQSLNNAHLQRIEKKKLELQRKAPGLQEGILQPTRDVKSRVTSPQVEQSTSKENHIEHQDELVKFFSQSDPFRKASSQPVKNPYTLALSSNNQSHQSQSPDQTTETSRIQQKVKSLPRQSRASFSYSSPTAQGSANQADKFRLMGFSKQSITTAIELYPTENIQLEFLYTIKELTGRGFPFEVSHIAFSEFGTNMEKIMGFMENIRIISDMGFEIPECAKALVNAKHDKDLALNMLLN